MAGLLKQHEGLGLNHELNGRCIDATTSTTAPPGFKLQRREVYLGQGKSTFKSASSILLRFGMMDLVPWAKIHTVPGFKEGSPLASIVRAYGVLWSFNPCKVIDLQSNRDYSSTRQKARVTQVCFSTTAGHLIAGEERLRVLHALDTDQVTFEMLSITRGAGTLGALAMPLIRPLQHWFFKDVTVAMVTATRIKPVVIITAKSSRRRQ